MICWFIRYHEGIRALVAQLLKKMQHNHNAEQLEALDDESIDDDVSYFFLFESCQLGSELLISCRCCQPCLGVINFILKFSALFGCYQQCQEDIGFN